MEAEALTVVLSVIVRPARMDFVDGFTEVVKLAVLVGAVAVAVAVGAVVGVRVGAGVGVLVGTVVGDGVAVAGVLVGAGVGVFVGAEVAVGVAVLVAVAVGVGVGGVMFPCGPSSVYREAKVAAAARSMLMPSEVRPGRRDHAHAPA